MSNKFINKSKIEISDGLVHKTPTDLYKSLDADNKAASLWESLTPLARNEWICWVTFVKKQETRRDHIKRVISELRDGKRRPCCWLGCVHRKNKQLSPSVKAILTKRHQI